ncbi:hypothetical protein OE88DRAFT_1243982 [Heliocybe sulcata]|uniref:F-box domain-containing protein n=1 Tax=Heliocybe sulcata TaxID=5364 RepID=A0A5C3N809_9AGAM|nr:hypothetical protein OE88DRAFT_1243982 [Heliocybe sulcata]
MAVREFLRRFLKRTPQNGQDAAEHGWDTAAGNSDAIGNWQGVFPPVVYALILRHAAPLSLAPDEGDGYREYFSEWDQGDKAKARTDAQAWFSSTLLVCSQWYEMGVPLLYQELFLRTYDGVGNLLRTLRARPELGLCARSLILPHRDPTLLDLCAESEYSLYVVATLYRVYDDVAMLLSACPSLRFVQMESPPSGIPQLEPGEEDGFDVPPPRTVQPELLTKLRSLTIHGQHYVSAILGRGIELPSLEELSIMGEHPRLRDSMGERPRLRDRGHFMELPSSSIQVKLPALSTLRLRYCTLTRETAHFSQFRPLTTLELTNVTLSRDARPSAEDIRAILPTGQVRTLQLGGARFSDETEVLLELSDLSQVQKLICVVDLLLYPISVEIGKVIQSAKNLAHLEIVVIDSSPSAPNSTEEMKSYLLRDIDSSPRAPNSPEEMKSYLLRDIDRIIRDCPKWEVPLRRLVVRGNFDETHPWNIKRMEDVAAEAGIKLTWDGEHPTRAETEGDVRMQGDIQREGGSMTPGTVITLRP